MEYRGVIFEQPEGVSGETYWTAALVAIKEARKRLMRRDEHEWDEVERFIKLEEYANTCLQLARSEHV